MDREPDDAKEHHHDLILDSLQEGVFTVDMDWRITSFNRAAEVITGVPRAQAVGRRCFEVFRADVCETGCILRRTMETRTPLFNMPVHIFRADRKRIPINVSSALLRDKRDRVVGGVETFQDVSEIKELRKAVLRQHSFEDLVSKNPRMQQIFGILPQVAQSGSTVLIEGASGTGKELIARAIHHHSPRREGPFVAVNCGALPDTLIESELFGYSAGAFTDARRDKPGRFALAEDGTIFLDEIGDISPAVQVRLLRVLHQKVYEPLGSARSVKTNARVIAATTPPTGPDGEGGEIPGRPLLPPQRVQDLPAPVVRTPGDIPLLVDHFVERFNRQKGRRVSGLSREAMHVLLHHDWPGNVRELENVIEHAFILCREDLIRLEDLPLHLQSTAHPARRPGRQDPAGHRKGRHPPGAPSARTARRCRPPASSASTRTPCAAR